MRILPIGSVIKVKDVKLMIVGHFSKDKETKVQYYYVTVPYPMGFVDKDKIIAVAINEDFEVVHQGYQTQRCEKYTEQMDKVSKLSKKEMMFYSRLAVEALNSVKK